MSRILFDIGDIYERGQRYYIDPTLAELISRKALSYGLFGLLTVKSGFFYYAYIFKITGKIQNPCHISPFPFVIIVKGLFQYLFGMMLFQTKE